MNFGTKRCPRMYRTIPWVGCHCVDCQWICLKRWIVRVLGIGPKRPLAPGSAKYVIINEGSLKKNTNGPPTTPRPPPPKAQVAVPPSSKPTT